MKFKAVSGVGDLLKINLKLSPPTGVIDSHRYGLIYFAASAFFGKHSLNDVHVGDELCYDAVWDEERERYKAETVCERSYEIGGDDGVIDSVQAGFFTFTTKFGVIFAPGSSVPSIKATTSDFLRVGMKVKYRAMPLQLRRSLPTASAVGRSKTRREAARYKALECELIGLEEDEGILVELAPSNKGGIMWTVHGLVCFTSGNFQPSLDAAHRLRDILRLGDSLRYERLVEDHQSATSGVEWRALMVAVRTSKTASPRRSPPIPTRGKRRSTNSTRTSTSRKSDASESPGSETVSATGVVGNVFAQFGFIWSSEYGRIYFDVGEQQLQCLTAVRFEARVYEVTKKMEYKYKAVNVEVLQSSEELLKVREATAKVTDRMGATFAFLQAKEFGRVFMGVNDFRDHDFDLALDEELSVGDELHLLVVPQAFIQGCAWRCLMATRTPPVPSLPPKVQLQKTPLKVSEILKYADVVSNGTTTGRGDSDPLSQSSSCNHSATEPSGPDILPLGDLFQRETEDSPASTEERNCGPPLFGTVDDDRQVPGSFFSSEPFTEAELTKTSAPYFSLFPAQPSQHSFLFNRSPKTFTTGVHPSASMTSETRQQMTYASPVASPSPFSPFAAVIPPQTDAFGVFAQSPWAHTFGQQGRMTPVVQRYRTLDATAQTDGCAVREATVQTEMTVEEQICCRLVNSLNQNAESFAWFRENMPELIQDLMKLLVDRRRSNPPN